MYWIYCVVMRMILSMVKGSEMKESSQKLKIDDETVTGRNAFLLLKALSVRLEKFCFI